MLNALVQDAVRAVNFLHSNGVFHCDIKPANMLVRLDRSGTNRSFKPKHFKEANLKVADFGTHVVFMPVAVAVSAMSSAHARRGSC